MSAWDPTTVIYSVIGATGVASFVVYVIAWKIHRQTLRYHALVAIQKDYRSHQMGYAVDRLWRFYREDCLGDENTLRKRYHEIFEKEQKEIDEKGKAKQIEARETTLDNQRRIVSHFYNHLAAIYVNKILPPEYIFENWSKYDLVIIPCILLPLENELINIINAEVKKLPESACKGKLKEVPGHDENSNLYKLYKGSLGYPNFTDCIYLQTVGWIGLIIAVIIWLYFVVYVF